MVHWQGERLLKTKNTVAEILITHNSFVAMECGYSDVSIIIISVHDAQFCQTRRKIVDKDLIRCNIRRIVEHKKLAKLTIQ